jgi:hypothetical protein
MTASRNVRLVASFDELLSTPFTAEVNALCWTRTLDGDFDAIAAAAGPLDEITTLDEEDLLSLSLGPAGQRARRHLLEDLRLLGQAGLQPSLDLIPAYPRDPDSSPVPIDVYDFHADSANTLADTFLCSYTVASSEGVANDEVVRRVDLPDTRARLLELYGGTDGDAFAAWLGRHCYDLHYAALPDAKPFSFGLGNLWRIATQCPGSPTRPCVHRAPETKPGLPPRLLLIS